MNKQWIDLVNRTRTSPNIEYIDDFVESLKEVYDYFPEHKDNSGRHSKDIVKYLTKKKIYALGMKDDTMEILNLELIYDPSLTLPKVNSFLNPIPAA